jgi:hypothetical protein
MRMRDEEGHRAMEAAGKAWNAIKTSGAKTWKEWIEVVGPGLVKARAEAQSVSNASSGKGYNTAMGALLQEYGFGDALERHRSQVTRADLLHCMDYLTEIEKWRQDGSASALLAVERRRKHRYPDHTTLNHPSVVWRQFKASKDGKRAFKERSGEVAKATKPKAMKPSNSDLVRELEAAKAHIAELEAARPVTPNAGDLDAARRAYVSLFPTDPCNARTELAALTQELGKITGLVGVGGLLLVSDEPMSARETGRLADFLATNLHLETAKALAKLLSKRRWPKQPVLSIDEYLDQQKAAKGDVKKEPLPPSSWSPRPPQSEPPTEARKKRRTKKAHQPVAQDLIDDLLAPPTEPPVEQVDPAKAEVLTPPKKVTVH